MSGIHISYYTNLLPTISVVVCTRDRPQELDRCLHALARLDYPHYEVIVVDNASRDPAVTTVAARHNTRYVREERPGLDWARNRGAAEARHAIIAYTDDDVQVDPGWLRGLAHAFAAPQVAAVTGLVLPLELATPAQVLFERYGGMSKGFVPRTFQRETLAARDVIAAHHAGVGANMAFRCGTLEQLGGFDTALDVGTPAHGGGDLDMFHRVLAAGLTLRYEPTALVWHQHRRDFAELQRQIENNGRSFGVYLLKIWKRRSVPRRATARFALGWVGGWLLGQAARSLRAPRRVSPHLAWAELWGALQAPYAYYATYQHDRRVHHQVGDLP